jgi:hypothetical protein
MFERLVVHPHADRVAFHDDVHGEPLIVLRGSFGDVVDVVKAPCPDRVAGVRVVDLNLESLRGEIS